MQALGRHQRNVSPCSLYHPTPSYPPNKSSFLPLAKLLQPNLRKHLAVAISRIYGVTQLGLGLFERVCAPALCLGLVNGARGL